jgi:hypothetical protein
MKATIFLRSWLESTGFAMSVPLGTAEVMPQRRRRRIAQVRDRKVDHCDPGGLYLTIGGVLVTAELVLLPELLRATNQPAKRMTATATTIQIFLLELSGATLLRLGFASLIA